MFFKRSDNYSLARRGIVAQTVSSFGLHPDYHQPSDELSRIDFPHLSRAIGSMVDPIEWLAETTWKPSWLPNGRP
jgi:aminopeptidase-like protein